LPGVREDSLGGLQSPFTWIVQGTIGGLIAAVAYDFYRLPFRAEWSTAVQVFPKFGELLLGSARTRLAGATARWSYHFSNGAALGIMFLAMVPQANRRVLFGAP
jgi:hypothetical protein